MKKTIALVTLVVFATISMMGCSSSSFESGEATKEATTESTTESTTTTETEVSDSNEMKLNDPFPIEVLGTIYQLYDTKEPTVNSTNLELHGSKYRWDFDESLYGRCIFENDEEICVDFKCSDNSLPMSVTITPHNESSEAYYEDFQSKYSPRDFFDLESHETAYIPLYPGRYPAGYYDLVILANDKPIAIVMIKLFEEGEIENSGKSPLDLQLSEIKLTRNTTSNETTT